MPQYSPRWLECAEGGPTAVSTEEPVESVSYRTWYFLPMHRGYLAAFEAIVRATVVDLGGQVDWALPCRITRPVRECWSYRRHLRALH